MNSNKTEHLKPVRAGTAASRRLSAVAGLTLALLAPLCLQAQQYDARDVAMLPAFCKHTQDFRAKVPGGNDPAEISRWNSALGPMFIHMHHYCYGLVDTNRANFFAHDQQERTRWLRASIGEFDYVIKHAAPDFVLLPEILTKKGENLIRLREGPSGTLELQRAIDLKPDYWPPYAAMSDYYSNEGNIEKAREWLDQALSVAPDAKALKERLVKLESAKGQRKAVPQAAGK